MEEGAVKVRNKIGRSESFPPTRHPQKASSGQHIDERGCSSVPTSPPQHEQADGNESTESNESKCSHLM
jgi:hypothetical protein